MIRTPLPATSNTVHAHRDGDSTPIDVRLVVAPVAGTFEPAPVHEVTAEGELVVVGDLIGHVTGPGRSEPVASFCTGFLVRLLAIPGERVRPGQPLVWLHPLDRPAHPPVSPTDQPLGDRRGSCEGGTP